MPRKKEIKEKLTTVDTEKGRISLRKNLVLKDGTTIRIEPVNGKEDPREFQRFINTLTKEGTYLLVDKPVTLKEEKQWLQTQIQAQRKGDQIYLKALVNGHLIADCFAKPGFGRNRGNINLGIAVAKNWRGKGIGHMLIEEIIVRSEQKWHPKNIYLHVVSANKKAHQLYESLGFLQIAQLPQWFEYNTTYLDEYILILDKKRFQQEKKKAGIR
ncbi:Acetyltransferase (GNAT) family protein [uncultured archaeon]|nr:Acetyltransferase (GNAT) family protein [uncultured archaeon]